MKPSAILRVLVLSTVPALAGPPPPGEVRRPADAGWEFRFAPYLWAQGLEGTTGVRGVTGDVDVSFGDIASDLDFAFMGAFEARHGRWSILTDINYAELSDSFATRDVLFSGGDFKMKQFMSNITLNYRAFESASNVIDLYGGARLNWVDLDLGLNGSKGGRFSRSGDEFWMDAIVGARWQTSLGGRWFLRVLADVGAGDSDLTWQAMGLIGYKISDTCNFGLGYRELSTDYHNGGFTYDITAHGPMLGVQWRW